MSIEWDDDDVARMKHVLEAAVADLNSAQILPSFDGYTYRLRSRPYLKMALEHAKAVVTKLEALLK